MAALPSNVSTGIVRISLRAVVLESSVNPVPTVMPVTGAVSFTPSPSFFRHAADGLIFPSTAQTVYLDGNGDAAITLMATDDPDITPLDWTYKVEFNLAEVTMDSFSITVPSGSDRNLSALTPVPASQGQYWTEDQYLVLQQKIEALGYGAPLGGVILAVGETPPASGTGDNGEPVLWISGGALLDPVPTVPQAPSFNLSAKTITVASTTGVEYVLIDGANEVPLTTGSNSLAGYALPFVAHVEARAIPGYVLTANYVWTMQFADTTGMVLVSSDGFSGTGGSLIYNRAWDKALGGTVNITWGDIWVTTNRMALNSAGNAATRLFGAQTERWGQQTYPMGANDIKLEISFSKFGAFSSRTAKFGFSGAAFAVACDSGRWEIQFFMGNATPTFNTVINVWKASGITESQVITGTWTATWVNRYLTVTCPDGTSYGQDYNGYTPNGWSWEQTGYMNVSDYGGGTTENDYPWIDSIKLYR